MDEAFAFLRELKGATGMAAVVGVVARYATVWLRNVRVIKALPAWLSGSKEGKPPTGWRVYVIVAVVSLVAFIGVGFLPGGTRFDFASGAAWVAVVKGLGFGVLSNELIRNFLESDKPTN